MKPPTTWNFRGPAVRRGLMRNLAAIRVDKLKSTEDPAHQERICYSVDHETRLPLLKLPPFNLFSAQSPLAFGPGANPQTRVQLATNSGMTTRTGTSSGGKIAHSRVVARGDSISDVKHSIGCRMSLFTNQARPSNVGASRFAALVVQIACQAEKRE